MNSDNLSSRHHYVPKFLIKNFADVNSLLWVYNKKNKRINKTQQSPKAIFFEHDRNTFEVNGIKNDNIEKMYGDVDDLLAKTLDKVIYSKSMSGRELTLLIFLVALTKWRLPVSDDIFKNLTKDIPLKDLGLKLSPLDPRNTVDKATSDKLETLDFVQEVKRLLIAIKPLTNEVLDEIHANSFIVTYDIAPAVLGDVPLIEFDNNGFDTLNDFIFPLGSYDTLICKRGANKEVLHPAFYLQKDLMVFHQSQNFVACKDRAHLENIIKIYEKLAAEQKLHLLSKYTFEFIV